MRLKEADEINPGLRQVILEREAASTGESRSDVGGWHSDDDLLDWPGRDFVLLKDTVRDAVAAMAKVTSGQENFEIRMNLTAWANVMRDRGYH